jgi:hypothetical protein
MSFSDLVSRLCVHTQGTQDILGPRDIESHRPLRAVAEDVLVIVFGPVFNHQHTIDLVANPDILLNMAVEMGVATTTNRIGALSELVAHLEGLPRPTSAYVPHPPKTWCFCGM